MGVAFAALDCRKALLDSSEILQVLQVPEDGAARVVILASARAPRKGPQAVFDLGRQAQGEQRGRVRRPRI